MEGETLERGSMDELSGSSENVGLEGRSGKWKRKLQNIFEKAS